MSGQSRAVAGVTFRDADTSGRSGDYVVQRVSRFGTLERPETRQAGMDMCPERGKEQS